VAGSGGFVFEMLAVQSGLELAALVELNVTAGLNAAVIHTFDAPEPPT
jgi:hypothetical protein